MGGRNGIQIGKVTGMGVRAEEVKINQEYNKKEAEKVQSR